jgi:hypothetical protein
MTRTCGKRNCAVGLMTKFVGGGHLDGLECGSEAVGRGEERVLFSGGLGGVEFVSEDEDMEAGPSRTVTAPELPMLTVTSPSPRKGKKNVKGKGRVLDVSEEGLSTIRKSEY